MLNIGVIGFGRLGKIHSNSVSTSEKAILSAVCDVDNIKLEDAKSQYGCATFNNLGEFLDSDLDAVIIASNTPQHLHHIKETAEHGIAIFTEKPVGLTLGDTDKVLSIVSKSNIPFQIGFQRRWDNRFIKAKEIVNSGDIGQPLLYKAYGRDPNASNPANWGIDKNGGLFVNAAIHDYDAARFILGQEVTKVSAIGATVRHKELEDYNDFDTAITTMLTDGGAIINTEWSRYATYGYDIGLEIIGTEGMLRFSSSGNKDFFVLHRNDEAPSVIDIFSESYKNQIDAFIEAISSNSLIKPSPGINDARIALNLALTARESASRHGTPLTPTPLRQFQ